jgi:predicted GTPase
MGSRAASETPDRPAANAGRSIGSSLSDAVRAAVREGKAEIARLTHQVDDALGQIENLVAADPVTDLGAPGAVAAAFADVAKTSRRQIDELLTRQRNVLGSFNIALFGRTGAGKSTLLSALAELDGSRVSQGESDWTLDVEPVDWHGCRLYDTPGINGWGRVRPRAELESAARRAVEVADVVLLCFDSQSQQAAEFKKVANWVQEYGKPVIAVLNNRNLMWRHPARVAAAPSRQNLSKPVREHASNIRDELSAIGLAGTPVVAIAAQRALDARAAQPYAGPDARNHADRRLTFGIDYLDRWSNLPALEDLLAATVSTGGSQLRLRVLREGLRTNLRDCGESVGQVLESATTSVQAVERGIEAALTVLGYPERGGRDLLRTGLDDVDVLTQLEDLRGAAFKSPSTGRLETHVAHLAASRLDPLRTESLRKAGKCVRNAFTERRSVSNEDFRKEVFDDDKIRSVTDYVWQRAGAFLQQELALTWEEASDDLTVDSRPASLGGRAGRTSKFAGDALRLSGVVTGAVTTVLGAVAVTQFWNPAGWVATLLLVGGGLLSGILGWLGKKTSQKAENQRLGARNEALGQVRLAVEDAYRDAEDVIRSEVCRLAWRLHSERLTALLREASDLQRGVHAASDWHAALDRLGREIPVSPAPLEVLDGAVRLVLQARGSLNHPEQVWLGEDWLDDSTPLLEPAAEATHALLEMRQQDTTRLLTLLPRTWEAPDGVEVRTWLDRLAAAGQRLPPATDLHTVAQKHLTKPPAVVFLGDYSSGKSSLIKRLLVDNDQPPPPTLKVRADPTTTAVEAHVWRHLQLLDTPGLQSGRDGHDNAGEKVVRSAALVIVVLHVNLMMGDATILTRLLAGTEGSLAALPRTLFVINRCDEFGVDPLGDPEEFRRRRGRKEVELRALLAAAGLGPVPVVHTISGDPFGLVGDRSVVTRADYNDLCRYWDGMAALEAALAATSAVNQHMQEREALATAHNGLLLIRQDLAGHSHQARSDRTAAQGVLTELKNAIDSGMLLASALEHRAQTLVRAHAERAMADVLSASHDQLEQAAQAAASWWRNPVFAADAVSYWTRAQRDLEQWTTSAGSAVRRSMPPGSQPPLQSVRAQRKAPKSKRRGAGRRAATAARTGSGASKILGYRDVVYGIGKAFGHNFKPWGAVKGAARLSRVGAVLGAVSVAFDVYGWVRDANTNEGSEQHREDLASFIEETIEQVTSKLTRALNPDGPLTVLDASLNDCRSAAAEITNELRQHGSELSDLARQLDLVHDLLHAVPEASSLREEPA